MTAKLTQLADMAQEKDCELMLDELLSFGEVPLSESVQQGIISRVTRKAEEDMTQAKPKKKIKRKLITFLVAAAILLPTGAYAAGRFFHKDNVEWYLKGSERIEQNENAVKNYVMENEDYKVTIDSQLSDGHNVMQIVTLEGKNSNAENELAYCSGILFTAKAEYSDGSDGPHFNNTENMFYSDGYAFGEHASSGDANVVVYSCKDIDTKKDLKLTYYRAYGDIEGVEITSDRESEWGFEKVEGFEYTTNFAPNVKTAKLKNADGKEIFMSEFEIYTNDNHFPWNSYSDAHFDDGEFYFIKNNGEKAELDKEAHHCSSFDYYIFGEIIDPDDYKGVEINGVEYLKQ